MPNNERCDSHVKTEERKVNQNSALQQNTEPEEEGNGLTQHGITQNYLGFGVRSADPENLRLLDKQ